MLGVFLLLLFVVFFGSIIGGVLKGVGGFALDVINPEWDNPNAVAPEKVVTEKPDNEKRREDLLKRPDGRGIL